MKDLKLLMSENALFFGTYNDIYVKNHDLELIENPEKISQDLVKIMLIEKGGHFLFANYGTLIATYINERKTDTISDNIVNEIIYAVTYVKQQNAGEDINIDEIQKLDVQDTIKGYEIVINILLTNGELLVIKKDYLR